MKKIIFGLIAVLFICGITFGAGTVTQTTTDIANDVRIVTLDCSGNATGGAIPDTAFPPAHSSKTLKGYYLYRVIIDNNSGDNNVTDDSDVYIKDPSGTDLLVANGIDQLDNQTRNYVRLTSFEPIITEQLTLDVDNQSENAGSYTITLIFAR